MASEKEIDAAAAALCSYAEFDADALSARRVARHALEAAERVRWQPIETAPKDGTFIWLSDGVFVRAGYWYVVTRDPTQEHWADMLGNEGDFGHLHFTPTRWQSLPRPPAERPGERVERSRDEKMEDRGQ